MMSSLQAMARSLLRKRPEVLRLIQNQLSSTLNISMFDREKERSFWLVLGYTERSFVYLKQLLREIL